MSNPLAVVVSDLHFGEESSVLHYGQTIDVGKQPVVNKLKSAIKKQFDNAKISFLIMAGDTLDFSLAPVHEAVSDFRKFLEDIHERFENFVYIPGNHDHHIWRTLQEEIYVINRIKEDRVLEKFPHEQIGIIENGEIVLPNVDPKKTLGGKTFLYNLLPDIAEKKNFAVTYPNLFIKFDKPEKNIIVTHGHFFEVAWTFVSDVFKKSMNLTTINYKTLERVNSPLTEFGWYGMGQAGELSTFIEKLYDELKNAEDKTLSRAIDELRKYLDESWTFKPERKEGFLSKVRGLFAEVSGAGKEAVSDLALKAGAALIKQLITSQIEEREASTGGSSLRHFTNILDDEDKRNRIRKYISYGYGQPYEFIPGQIIFGHTHMPFKNGNIDMTVQGRTINVAAFNTGGWIVDSENAEEIVQSRPMPFAISDNGDIQSIDISWPTDVKSIENMKCERIIDIIQKGNFK